MNILALNAGSSSLKAALYAVDGSQLPDEPQPSSWSAHAEWADVPGKAAITVRANGNAFEEQIEIASTGEAFEPMMRFISSGSTGVLRDIGEIDVVGHRVVHGGLRFRDSTRITTEARSAIEQLRDLAPVHNQFALEGIDAVSRIMGPGGTQIAVFDTAFHASLPPAAYSYAGPYAWLEQGIRRYGFHGISHQYAAARAAKILGRDLRSLSLISCHLGGGCSVTAINGGRSVDTTMGFTPLDGLMMGTRSGSVDPGILIYLMRQREYSADQIDHTLNHESGLWGVSGISADMRQILAAKEQGNGRAQLAFEAYVHSVRRHIGAMLPSLTVLDALIFTAGVGENSPEIRSAVCDGLAFLGLALDPYKNAQSEEGDISPADSPVRILVVKTREEWAIACESLRVADRERERERPNLG